MDKSMNEKVINNTITKSEIEKRENEIRSNLRYCWQRAMAFAITKKPTIQEVKEELEESFLAFIPLNNNNRQEFRIIINQAFTQLLGRLFSSDDITNLDYENEFINSAINGIRKLLKIA
jgi:hypothetical protein